MGECLINQKMNPNEAKEIINQQDIDKDKKLNFHEFINLIL